ncbi:hypothetical protein ACXJJ3_30860 [Kribbella sp. WER1]
MGQDAAGESHRGQTETHLEHPGCVGHHPVELRGDPDRPADVPGDPGELVRQVRQDRDGDRPLAPTQGGVRAGPRLLDGAAAARYAHATAAPVVRQRGRRPEHSTDEQDDQVHAAPVQNVTDATLRSWHAGERKHNQGGRQRDNGDQCVVRNHQGQPHGEYCGYRLQEPLAGRDTRHHECQHRTGQADRRHHRRDHVVRRTLQDRARGAVVRYWRKREA